MKKPFLHLAISVFCGAFLFAFVDLTPEIDENFFFSSDDPQFQTSRRLEEMFELPPLIIMTAEGDIRSRPYLTKVALLTEELQRLKGVTQVLSLGSGPSSVEGAIKSPLWSRAVVATGERGSNFLLLLEDRKGHGELVEKVNSLKSQYDASDFRLAITGVPYVVHEIQKQLADDMKRFTLAAVLAFSLVIFVIYRSKWIWFGAVVCAATAAFLVFILLWLFGVNPGPLSANLWSIVFVLTLSHVVFISGNWELISRSGPRGDGDLVSAALRETGTASIWSMITNSLGFLTLLLTAAKPIRQFGLAGLIGAILALVVAYTLFPAFLRMARPPPREESRISSTLRRFVSGRHTVAVLVMSTLAVIAVTGFGKITTQPPIFSYFERDGRLREDLYRIDQLGGASPFYVAVKDQAGAAFVTDESYIKLWKLQLDLEEHPMVGEVISLPTVLGEFVMSPFASLLTWDLIYEILDLPLLGAPGLGIVTQDRKTALFMLRMKESELGTTPRQQVVDEIHQIVRDRGFDPVLSGGLFKLTGELSSLVSKSLLQGVVGLVVMLFIIALIVSRSISIAFAVICSLVLVPLTVLGAAGYLKLPLEIISTPAINLAMGLGVDEMIHLVHKARKGPGQFDFEDAKRTLWKPVSASCLMLSVGFSVFWLSHFPPTQNLGWLVVIGSAVALIVMLLVFPTIAAMVSRPGKTVEEIPLRKAA